MLVIIDETHIFINKINRYSLLRFISFILLFTINLSTFDEYLFDILEDECCMLVEEQEDESKEENKKSLEEVKLLTEKQLFNLGFALERKMKSYFFFESNYLDSHNKLIHTPPPEVLA